MTIGWATGCAGFSEAERDEATSDSSAAASAHSAEAIALYQSLLATYEERALDVEVASEEMLLVSSSFEEVSQGVRRRFISRVIAFGGNIALNIVAEYQELKEGNEAVWEGVTAGSSWGRQAASEELEFGRAVERHFHRNQRRR